MSVYLLERAADRALVRAVDVRANRSVEDVADEIKAREVGRMLVGWWQRGRHRVRLHAGGPGVGPMALDLRRELLRALGAGLRISPTAKYLRLSEDGRSGVHVETAAHYDIIGRDLLAWWAEPEGSHRVTMEARGRRAGYDIRIGLNESMREMLEKRAKA